MNEPGYYTRAASNFSEFEVVSSQARPRDRALVFGLVDQATLDSAGNLASIMHDLGAAYIHSADGLFASDDSGDDDGTSFAAQFP